MGIQYTASYCNVGSKLRTVKGSTCATCYAMRGKYPIPVVNDALERRYASLDNPEWANAMAHMINTLDIAHFRWHDSGDVKSVAHLTQIVEVARMTPNTEHWLPSREYQIVEDYLDTGTVPDNLVIRTSAPMVDGPAVSVRGLPTSTVIRHTEPDTFICQSKSRGNRCGSCRACWNPDIPNVAYPWH